MLVVDVDPGCHFFLFPSQRDLESDVRPMYLKLLCPMSESLSGKREGFQDNATRIKGKFLLLTRVRVPAARPMQWYGVRER